MGLLTKKPGEGGRGLGAAPHSSAAAQFVATQSAHSSSSLKSAQQASHAVQAPVAGSAQTGSSGSGSGEQSQLQSQNTPMQAHSQSHSPVHRSWMHVPHSVSSISVQQASQALHRPVCGAAQCAEPRDAEASERCGASTAAGSSVSAKAPTRSIACVSGERVPLLLCLPN